MSKDLKVAITVSANTSGFVNQISEAERRWKGVISGMGATAAKIQMLPDLRKRVAETEQALGAARMEMERLGNTYRKALDMGADSSFQKKLFGDHNAAIDRVKRLTRSLEQQKASLTTMDAELRKAGVDTSRLAEEQARLTDQVRRFAEASRQSARLDHAREILGVRPHRDIEREIAAVRGAYERLRAAGTATSRELAQAHLRMTDQVRTLTDQTNGWRGALWRAREELVQLAVAAGGLAVVTREAVQFESAMSDVRKVVDFPTPQAFKEMTDDIKGMSREIPIGLVGLAKIAESGGQMGIAARNIREFTELTAKMSTAFKISSDEAGTAVGRMMNIFSLTVPQTRLLADAINHLGNNTNAVERDIVEVMNRTGGMTRVFGLANTQTAALAATFLSMGLGPERSATAISALTRELMNAPQQTDKFKSALQRIGMTAEQLAVKIHRGPQEAILELLQTLNGLDPQTKMETLVGLFGDLYSDEIVQVVNNLDKYREILRLVAKESSYAGSMQREFAERIKTADAQLQLAKNAISEAAINLGSAFLPGVVAAAKGVAVLTHGLADLADAFPKIAAAASLALTAFAGFGAIKIIWSALRVGVASLLPQLTSLAGVVMTTKAAAMAASLSFAALATSVGTSMGKVVGAFSLLRFTPIGMALTAAGVAAYAFSKAMESSVPPLMESAAAMGKSRAATLEKIKTLEDLRLVLRTTTPGTKEHAEAEEKLADILPEANLSLDEQGRILARVGGAADENSKKLQAYLDLLKKEDRQGFALQLEAQARAFVAAKGEMGSYVDSLKFWYGIGTEGAAVSTQRFWLWLNKLTGTYDENIAKGAELRRHLTDTRGGLKSLLEEAQKAGMSVEELGRAMDGIHADAETREQVVSMYRAITKEADDAAAKTDTLTAAYKRASLALTGPAAAAKKTIIDAIETADKQLTKYDDALSRHRQSLQQAVEAEAQSWRAVGAVATTATREATDVIARDFERRRRRLEDAVGRNNVATATRLAIEESRAKLREAHRFQTEAAAITQQEYQVKRENAERLKQEVGRINEEQFAAQRRILEQTETAYRQSIDNLITEERRHLEESRRIAEERASFNRSINDRIDSLREKAMGPQQKYNDRQRRIAEERTKAENALRQGDYESARRHAEKMIQLAEQTAEAVKVGDRSVVTEKQAVQRAIQQVQTAARIANETYIQQQKSHQQAAKSLRQESDGLIESLGKIHKTLGDIDASIQKEHKLLIDADIEKVKEAASQVDDLLEKKERVVQVRADLQLQAQFLEELPKKIEAGVIEPVKIGLDELSRVFGRFKDEFAAWDPEVKAKFDATAATGTMEGLFERFRMQAEELEKPKTIKVSSDTSQAVNSLAMVQGMLNGLKDKTVTVTTQYVEKHSGGGMAGGWARFARGGLLPGFGGGDRIQALLEAGEIIFNKDIVRAWGADFLLAINAGIIKPQHLQPLPRFQAGGLVQPPLLPPIPIPRFSMGGLVNNLVIPSLPSPSNQSSDTPERVFRLDITNNGRPAATIRGDERSLTWVLDALHDKQRGYGR